MRNDTTPPAVNFNSRRGIIKEREEAEKKIRGGT